MRQQPLVTISLEEYEYLTKKFPLDVIVSLANESVFPAGQVNQFQLALDHGRNPVGLTGLMSEEEFVSQLNKRCSKVLKKFQEK